MSDKDNELCTHVSAPARGRLPSFVRSLINREAHARALAFEKEEKERLLREYLEKGTWPDPHL